jgi:uncharacterized protein
VLLAGLIALTPLLVPAFIPAGLIDAPNARRPPPADLPPEALRELGVTGLRLRVGPPDAELSIWVLDPAGASSPGSPGRGGAERRRSAPTVLVLHGIRDSKRSMYGWGRRLAAAGLRAVLVDLRGQGSSSGRHLTYGVLDRRDLSQVLDQLLARGLVSAPFGVFGASYGGATAIQLAGVDPRVEAVVAVAPFADLRSVVPDYLRCYLPVLWRLVPASRIQRAIDEAGRQAAFDPDQASPRLLLQRARARLLILHGSADRNIPLRHTEEIQAVAPDRVERVVLPGRDHNGVMGDPEVAARALPWLQRFLRR